MARAKGITPIISIIVLLLIAVALAGAAWTYISGFTSSYTSKVIDLPPGSSYFDGRNVKIMLRNIGTSAINTGSCTVSGTNNNTVTCGDITITREGSAYDADIRPGAASISPKGLITIIDYNCQAGNVKYVISSPTSTYQVNVNADTFCSLYSFGAISWWRFEGDAKDSAGSNHGTLVGDAEINNGVLVLDGNGDYINMGNVIILEGSNDATISAWVKPNTYATDGACNGGNCDFIVFDHDFGYYFSVQASGLLESGWGSGSNWGSTAYTKSTGTVGLGFWTHVTVTKDNGVVKYYINGNLDSTKNDDDTAIGTVSGNFQISKHPGGDVGYWDGSIDDVMVFKRALSPEEIKAIYNSQKK